LSEPLNQEPGSEPVHPQGGFPPKPQLSERKQGALLRSLISLFFYGLLFYFLFDRNITYISAILLVIIIHELGHLFLMKLSGYSNPKIFILPLLGAFTSGKQARVSQWQMVLIILAGPLPGIIIGSFLYWMNISAQSETLKMLANAFLIINLINCLPFYPLDGGRLLETLFFRESHLIRLVFGIISVIVMLLLFIAFSSPLLMVIPALIAFELYNENKHQKIREYLEQEKINYRTGYDLLPDKDYWLIRDCLILSFPKKYAGVEAGRNEYSLVEPLFIGQINALLQPDLKSDLSTGNKLLFLFFYLFLLTAPLALVLMNR
jgi:stage IV sporulation protein FB